jgi:hypothetical protein
VARGLIVRRAQQKNPHDFLEDLALSNEWGYERLTETQMALQIDFQCGLNCLSHWDDCSGYLDFMGVFEIPLPERRKKDVFEVLSALSLDTRLGYFTLCEAQGFPMFRHALLAYPKNPITFYHVADVMEDLISGGEKLCQAMRFLIDEKKTSSEAVFASLIEVMGEA